MNPTPTQQRPNPTKTRSLKHTPNKPTGPTLRPSPGHRPTRSTVTGLQPDTNPDLPFVV